jgi:hypothetical protein
MPYLPPLLSHKFGFDLAIALCPMAIRHFIGDGSILQTSDFRLKCSRGHAHGCHVPFHSGANQTSMTSTLPRSSTMPCWTAWISGYRRDKIRICWTYSPIAIAYKLESIVEDTALRLPEETPRCGENRRRGTRSPVRFARTSSQCSVTGNSEARDGKEPSNHLKEKPRCWKSRGTRAVVIEDSELKLNLDRMENLKQESSQHVFPQN